ncbi:MAG: twin-arginine translocation signal domain-containing protein, partial [Candidatus Aminicenantes bacterium]|nr:twin-arginine translocation signal domain-containing protein [Candidatus Aminicenantes bacterium]
MTERTSIDRRQFLKKSAAGVLGAGLIGPVVGPLPQGAAGQGCRG